MLFARTWNQKVKDRGLIHLSESAQNFETLVKEGGLLIANHNNSDMDWYWSCELLVTMGFPPATIKWFVKEFVLKVPVFGAVARASGQIALSRDWNEDRNIMAKAMQDMIAIWPRPHIFGIFPEGTRKTPERMELAKKFAEERGLKVLNNFLQPRVKGFMLAVDVCRRSGIKYLWNCTTLLVPKSYNFLDLILGRYHETKIHLEIIKLSDLPEGKEELSAWLRSAWVEKDILIDRFRKEGIKAKRVIQFKNLYGLICGNYLAFAGIIFLTVSRRYFSFAIYWFSFTCVCPMYLFLRHYFERKAKLA